MTTLKMSHQPAEGPAKNFWLTDVESVEEVERVSLASWDDYGKRFNGMLVKCWISLESGPKGDDGGRAPGVYTLITVKTARDTEAWVVQWAWLLGQDGQTIDRIAP